MSEKIRPHRGPPRRTLLSEKKKGKGLLGHIFSFLFPEKKTETPQTKVEQTAEKIEELKKRVLELRLKEGQIQFPKEERFKMNYRILVSPATDFSRLQVQEGKLVFSSKIQTTEEKEAVKALIQQTYRQAWGRIIDANHGYLLKEKALKEVNDLKTVLSLKFPEGIPRFTKNQPLKILTGDFNFGETLSKKDKKTLEDLKENKEVSQKFQRHKEKTQGKIDLVRTFIFQKPLTAEQTGIHPAAFLREYSGETVALKKRAIDEDWGESMSTLAKLTSEAAKEKCKELSNFNESLMTQLDLLMDGRLKVPLTLDEKKHSVHAFVQNKGTYYTLMQEEGKEVVLHEMPTASAQQYVFAQLISGNSDAHAKNILITPQGDPIGIDYGRILPIDPTAPVVGSSRGIYFDFPCLEVPINESDKSYYELLDVEELVDTLKGQMQLSHADFFEDMQMKSYLDSVFDQLKARFYMVQIGVKEGATQRELLALNLPPFSDEVYATLLNVLKNKEWEETQAYLIAYMTKYGFRKAWKESIKEDRFDSTIFQKVIKEELRKIRKYGAKNRLFGPKEKDLYRRGLIFF